MKTGPMIAAMVLGSALVPAVAEDGVFDSNGVQIRYVTEGEGEAIVLIHGWMADSSMWGRDASGSTKLDTTDAEGFRVIALDCRGHGRSGKPHDAAAYGPEMAADVVRLLDHLKIDKAHLIGYSSGAFIAGHVAANHPDRVRSVVYAGQAPVIEGAIRPTDFSECDTFAKAVEEGGKRNEGKGNEGKGNEGKGLGSYILAVTPANRPQPTPEQADAIADYMFKGKDVKAMALAGSTFKDLAVTPEQLKACAAPTLFVHGGEESEHVKGRVAKVHALLGGAEGGRAALRIIEGGDHMTTLAKPEFGTAIREFLRANMGK